IVLFSSHHQSLLLSFSLYKINFSYMKFLSFLVAVCFLCSCNSKQKIDLLVFNATVYTIDSAFTKAEAIAVDKGKIVETGTNAELQKKYDAAENVDAQGKFIF